jgi:hypothetical protein
MAIHRQKVSRKNLLSFAVAAAATAAVIPSPAGAQNQVKPYTWPAVGRPRQLAAALRGLADSIDQSDGTPTASPLQHLSDEGALDRHTRASAHVCDWDQAEDALRRMADVVRKNKERDTDWRWSRHHRACPTPGIKKM